MKALLVRPPAAGVALEEVDEPTLGPGQVQVRVLECGVCGTDRDIAGGQYGTPPAGRSSLILGHENLGVVESVGPEVDGWSAGDLVVATVRRGCGECRFCRTNQSDVCETGRFTERGIRGADGFLAQRYVERPEYLVHVPEDLRPVAVLLEPLSVVEKAVHEGLYVLARRGESPGAPPPPPVRALVAGTGAIGMLASFLLRSDGCDVTAVDRHGEGTAAGALLRRIGGKVVNVSTGLGALGDGRFDLVVEASGNTALDLGLPSVLAPNGVLVLTGIPNATPTPLPFAAGPMLRQVVLENQAIVGSVNANRSYFEAGRSDLARFRALWGDAIDSVLTERRPMAEFDALLNRAPVGGMKSVLVVS